MRRQDVEDDRDAQEPDPTVAAIGPVFRRGYTTKSMIEHHGPSGECPRCETGQGLHSETCRLRFEKVRIQQSELKRAEIPPTTTTTTAPATTSAPSAVHATSTSNLTLDSLASATGVPLPPSLKVAKSNGRRKQMVRWKVACG